MNRLQSRAGVTVYQRLGLLWRDAASLETIRSHLLAEDVEHIDVPAAVVGDYIPGLRPDGRDGIFTPEGGIVLADITITAQHRIFESLGGDLMMGRRVREVSDDARIELDDGSTLRADVVVLAPGPGARDLLPQLGIDVALHPVLEQVAHFTDPSRRDAMNAWPCLFDGPAPGFAGIYAMPSPGIGYKIGIDAPLRPFEVGDDNRTPDPDRRAEIVTYASSALPLLPQTVVDEHVCTWTDSPDGGFILDRIGDVVIACGDSGKGFKFSALIGEILADLAEAVSVDADVASMSLARLADIDQKEPWVPTAMGTA
jgi:glycine/D-amino acid oxidase-like deaminating enzyme